jgi:hypothetical protein
MPVYKCTFTANTSTSKLASERKSQWALYMMKDKMLALAVPQLEVSIAFCGSFHFINATQCPSASMQSGAGCLAPNPCY